MSYASKSSPSNQGNGGMADLIAAVQEADANHQKRLKKNTRSGGWSWFSSAPEALKTLGGAGLLLLAVLIGDGIRREAGETSATFAQVGGRVTLQKGGAGADLPATPRLSPAEQDVIRTGPDGSATLAFADGSALQIEPNTELQIRLLDFARGGVRSRSVMVRSGRVVARISGYSGSGSETTLCTPTSVAISRDGGFSVYYDPARRETYVGVVDGTVQLKTSAGQSSAAAGQMVASAGYRVGAPGVMNPRQQSRLRAGYDALGRYEKAPGFVQTVEYGINAFCDPALQLLGLAPGSWSYAAGYAARRSATLEALKRLQQHMVSLQDEQIPEYVSLTTMEELGVDPEQKRRIMDTFAGNLLDSYRKTGTGAYDIRARSRDKGRTLYSLTPQGVVPVKE